MIVFAMAAAFGIWMLCMRLLGSLIKGIEFFSTPDWAIYRVFFSVFIYSVAVVYFNREFKKIATKIVVAENHKYKKDHEESMIRKNYTLGAFNSYLGMAAAAFYDRKFENVCMLLLTVLMLKQFIMNLIDLIKPGRSFGRKFRNFEDRINKFFEDNPEDYQDEQIKRMHKEAERHTLLNNMPPMMVPVYNEIMMQLGWILYFSMAFPAGAFFCVFACFLRVHIELTAMAQYKRKDQPMP